MVFLFLAAACTDQAALDRDAALAFLGDWFDQANAGAREESLCHAFGVLKHPEFTCADMLEHAARVDPATRTIASISPMACFGDVCGDFLQVEFDSRDPAGNEVSENAVLKRDEGRFRLYWYRSDTLLAELRASQPDPEEAEAKDPEQVAYDQLVARYPALYSYPPCYGVRASSSNLRGKPTAIEAIDPAAVEARAAACGETFCFALVGSKIATLCPTPR